MKTTGERSTMNNQDVMTVKELIEQLQKFSPETKVLCFEEGPTARKISGAHICKMKRNGECFASFFDGEAEDFIVL